MDHESRYFPREFGRIELRYQVIAKRELPAAGRAWVQGLSKVEPERPWYSPHPYMDFSASGLCFHDGAPLEADDVLLLELRVPAAERPIRATGRVVRADALDSVDLGEAGAMRRVAVDFVDLSAGGLEALVQFTEDCQSKALGVYD